MSVRAFTEGVVHLEKTTEWLNSLGISTSSTRFEELVSLYRQIVTSLQGKTVEALIDKYGNLVLWQVLSDADSFIRVHSAFGEEKSHLLPRKNLKAILDGPILPWDETPSTGNIAARNILFELEMASSFRMCDDVKVVGFDDVDFRFDDVLFNVQCKRIHSPKKVKDNIEKAKEQFTARMHKPGTKGILCLSIDKLTKKEDMILHVDSSEEITPIMTSLVDGFMREHQHLWSNMLNTNILGVIVCCKLVSWIRKGEGNVQTTCRQMMVDILPSNNAYQSDDRRLMVELAKRLSSLN